MVLLSAKFCFSEDGAPGFGVSFSWFERYSNILLEYDIPYLLRILMASSSWVGSGTVGPEPIVWSSSPGTSDMQRVNTCAG